MPLEQLNPAKVSRFYDDTIWPVFERLRREDPIHFTPDSEYGPYWSITKWTDIMAVDTNHEAFSSADGITLINQEAMAEQIKIMGERRRGGAGFITMDEPQHSFARKAVSPTLAPSNLHAMAPQVRERAGQILDSLPIGQEFDWVDLVSKELTAMTLATLFDFPFEQRRKLPWWSDMIMNQPGHGPVETWEQKGAAMFECFNAFHELWNERVNSEPRGDLISMLAHNPATRDMPMETYQGNVILLIVGGNDTTRNTISSSVHALNQNPDQYAKLRANPDLILSMVSETIRWQTPLAHMARVATRDVEMGGKTIKKGDRVAMVCAPRGDPSLKLVRGPFWMDGEMAKKRHKPEEIVAKLRQVDVLTAQGQSIAEAVRTIAVTETTYFRWRAEYGGLKSDQVKRLKDLELENARLRRAVSDLTLDKLILTEAARGNF